MDFQTFKRRDLQSLCKLNNIPANTTNAAMADALASLPIVEGLADFLARPDSETQGSPERSAINSSYAPRTTATRTRCSTRTRAVEGTDARKTPATRTTRKRASQEASIQTNMQKNMEAEFEAEKEQSEVTDNSVLPGGEIKEISEVVSGVSVEIEGQIEPQKDVEQQVNDGQEVIDLDAEEEATEMSNDSNKLDFHSFSRKDLQTLCKRNKKPANTTNAAMAASLESLEIVEGLQELLMGCDSQVPSSPMMSGITSSCARRSRTTMKISREEPPSSKLITKSCRVSRKRIVEETDQGKNDVAETSVAPSTQKEGSAVQWDISSVEISEVSGVAENNDDMSKSNDDLLNVENLTESSELVAKVDNEFVVEDESHETVEVIEAVVAEGESHGTLEVIEAVANFAIQDEGLKLGSADSTLETIMVQNSSETESQDGQLENAVESLDENLAITHAEDQMSKEFVSESTTEADQVTLEINEDGNSGNTKLEKAVTFTFDSDVPEPAEDEVSEADKPSLETNMESEGSCTEDESDWSDYEMPEDDEVSDSELAIQDDLLSVEANVDSESEKSQLEKLDITDSATDLVEKPEVSLAELLADQFDTESTIQVRSCVPTESKTPLNHKSLRKLKRMYKEKLQEKTLVEGMEKLDLDESEVPLANADANLQKGNVEAPVSQVMLGSNEANEDDTEESEENTVDETGSEKDKEDVIQETLVNNSVGENAELCPVDILLDNEVVSEEAVVGDIDVVLCPTLTPSKCSSVTKKPSSVSMVTPTKSACKTPMSAGIKNRVMDVNKENIDSISKTEPGKIKVAVTESGKILSALGMLKKEFKGLQQSEKKKKALQSRSDNQNLLASP